MGDRSGIEWTDATWNMIRAIHLLTGRIGWHCEHISPACLHCYAAQTNKGFFNLGTKLPYIAQSLDQIKIYLDEETLTQPLRWQKPRKIFVCSMTDLFGSWVEDAWLDKIFNVMYEAKHHTFQVLTKRPERMLDYISRSAYLSNSPLENVWLGVTAENQKTADNRIPLLLQTPAATRFISAEPLLEQIDLGLDLIDIDDKGEGFFLHNKEQWHPCEFSCGGKEIFGGIDWVICGGESGSKARPMHPAWARSLRDQCASAGVSFFFKQWGEWLPVATPSMSTHVDRLLIYPNGNVKPATWSDVMQARGDVWAVERVGKHRAGRLLEGQEWNGFPNLNR